MALLESLKGRLIAMAVLWIGVAMIAGATSLSAVFRQHVVAQFHDELFVHLEELQRLSEITQSGASLSRPFSDPRYEDGRSGYYWEIQRHNSVLARSKSLEGPMLQTPAEEPRDVKVHTHVIEGPTGKLIVAEQARWQTASGPVVRYLIGTDERHLNAVISEFNRTLWLSLLIFAASLIAAAALLIRYALRPLTQLRAALSLVRSGEKQSLEVPLPTEVRPLADDLNSLLLSTTELVQRARTQAGNIAHSLKTPLAVLTDEAHRLEKDGHTKPSETIVTQIRKMQAHIDHHIARARAAAAHVTIGNSTAARIAVDEVISALKRLYSARMFAVANIVPAGLRMACDRQDLNEIVANILDNAFKHAKNRIEVSAEETGAGRKAILNVDDDGEGLPPEAREIVFNVGERWDSQEPGTGLGLAIARDLARLYGGDVVLSESPLGGLRVRLTLPRVETREV